MASTEAATEYDDGSSGASLRPWPSWSQTTTVWSVARAATVRSNILDDAANPCVSSTTGPCPCTSWKVTVLVRRVRR